MGNKMKEVAKLLGVEIGEEFNILGEVYNPFCIDEENGLMDRNSNNRQCMLTYLLLCEYTIERQPFKPNYGGGYYYATSVDGAVAHSIWQGNAFDYYCYNANNCFKTEEEITEEDIQRIVREMKEPYEKENKQNGK